MRELLPLAVRQVVDAATVWASTEKVKPPAIAPSGAFITIILQSPLPVSLARAAEAAGFTPSGDPTMERWTSHVPCWDIPQC